RAICATDEAARLLEAVEEPRPAPVGRALPETALFAVGEKDRPVGRDGYSGGGTEAVDQEFKRGVAGWFFWRIREDGD
ncbi:MAG TPA: hypothetical protein VIH84_04630, partial [Candidatus Methylomirabilis sp.]